MKKIRMISGMLRIVPIVALSVFALAACSKKNDSSQASATIKMTDAPFDDAAVSAVFVTVADIKLDGQSIQGFTKTTFNLAAYQNGLAKTLGTFNLDGKVYSSISFVLDYNTDASGAAPGCYVLTTANVKHKLETTSNIITVTKSMTIENSSSNSIVADFDLRKMIVHQTGTPSDHFNFATSAELQNDVRIIFESQSGAVSGTLSDNVSGSAKVVAYLYKKGTFVRATEMQGQGASSVQFQNAVSSTVVAPGGLYQLHFLEGGAYEVHFASYKDTNADGEFELQGTLIVTAGGLLDLLNLNVSANTTLTVNATATGVLP